MRDRMPIHEARERLIRAGYRIVAMNRCLCVYGKGKSVAIYYSCGMVPCSPVHELESA